MNTARAQGTATLLSDGRVLIAGGETEGSDGLLDPLATAELYDPQSGTFSPTGSMTAARFGHAATLLSDGRVLISGGTYGGMTSLASAELYDPKAGTFSPTGSMATARVYHTATLLFDGRVLTIGGEEEQRPSLLVGGPTPRPAVSAEVYDPRTGAFGRTGSMGTDRDNCTSTLLRDGRVLITGGVNHLGYSLAPLTEDVLASAELYDPSSGTFSPTGSMTVGRHLHTATLLLDGRVLVAGGTSPKISGGTVINIPQATVELFDPLTGTFGRAGSMTTERSGHTATLLSDGRVLIAGGGTTGDLLPSAELYDPGR